MKQIQTITCTLFYLALVLGWGCSPAEESEVITETTTRLMESNKSSASEKAVDFSFTIPWGVGPNEMRLHSHADVQSGSSVLGSAVRDGGAIEGPSDLVAMDGASLLVLDRFNRRIVKVSPSGSIETVANTPEDGVHLERDPGGGFGVYSPLRSEIRFYDNKGSAAGMMMVPRQIRGVRGFQIGASRQITIHTAFQSRFSLGSPAAPLPLHSVLRSLRKGILPDAAGAGTALMLDREKGEVSLLRIAPESVNKKKHGGSRAAERSRAVWRMSEELSAARLVGRLGETVCMKLEKADSIRNVGPPETSEESENLKESERREKSKVSAEEERVVVKREVLCVDQTSGEVRLRKKLPDVGLYIPGRELVMSTNPPARVVHMLPSTRGLEVRSWGISRRRGRRLP